MTKAAKWTWGWNGDACAVWGVSTVLGDTKAQKERRAKLISKAPLIPELGRALEEARSGLIAHTGGVDGACADTIKRIDGLLADLKGSVK